MSHHIISRSRTSSIRRFLPLSCKIYGTRNKSQTMWRCDFQRRNFLQPSSSGPDQAAKLYFDSAENLLIEVGLHTIKQLQMPKQRGQLLRLRILKTR
ncbi:hypothetical protein Nepgr_014921 [Nepenthes gracilis]|uniref:Uncharacterized protein n=1 Tax=Nepenthes gracilis TaxID=150966 RepID=A0AAD3XQY5_NEPGR|nr:hypothetical protein Nepgr_014921 [Nepenthes gracilis]